MRKLSMLETKEALDRVLKVEPAEFEVELLNVLPGNYMDQLIDANVESAIKRWPTAGIDMQRQIAAFGMSGFQLGWLLAKEIYGRGDVL